MANQNNAVTQSSSFSPFVMQPGMPERMPERKKRGFAAMDRTQVRELARKGGIAAHSAGTAHEFSSEEAREAGRKGGLATHSSRRPPDGQSHQEEAERLAIAPSDV
jgi:general stress protein YciG